MVERAYLGVDEQPIMCRCGHARAVWTYDLLGNEIKATYFDASGREISNP